MNARITDVEGRALHGLIEDAAGDIVVRLDASGFVIHASANASQLGIDLESLLLMPHIADFADTDHTQKVADHVAHILDGGAEGGWIEFPVRDCFCASSEECDCPGDTKRRWFAFSMRLIEADDGVAQGALGLLRSIQARHTLEGEINARSLTDPVTGLANRHAFCASLRREIAAGGEHTMAVFAIDRMRSVFMQYGQSTTDEIQWGFAKFLETMALPDHEVARLGGDRFGALLPGTSTRKARAWADDVLRTFAGLTVKSSSRSPELTASAGLAQLEMTVDWTLRQAELGLVMARAGGGMQVGVVGRAVSASIANRVAEGAKVERAINEAVKRAEQRRAS